MTTVALALPLADEQRLVAEAGRHGHRVVARCSGADDLAAQLETARPELAVTAAAPTVLVSGATVVKVLDDTGSMSVSSSGSSVEVLVPRTRVARLLEAIASKDALAIVPAGIPLAESDAAKGDGS